MTREEFKNNPEAQKKFYILIGAVGLALLWLLYGGSAKTALRVMTAKKQSTAVNVQPPPNTSAVTYPPRVVAAPAPQQQPQSNLSGQWRGTVNLERLPGSERGHCTVTLKITQNPDGSSAGYSTLGCAQTLASMMNNNRRVDIHEVLKDQAGINNPSSAILTGTRDASGKLHFTVNQNIGVAEALKGCNMTSAEATPFADGLSFSWKEDGCSGGELIMTRVAR